MDTHASPLLLAGELERVLRCVAPDDVVPGMPLDNLRALNDFLEKQGDSVPITPTLPLTSQDKEQLTSINERFKAEYSQRKKRIIDQFHALLDILLGSDRVPAEVAQAVREQARTWLPDASFTIEKALNLSPRDLESILVPTTRPPFQVSHSTSSSSPRNVDVRSIIIKASRADVNRSEKKPIGKRKDKGKAKKQGDLDEGDAGEQEEHEDRPAKPLKPERIKPKKELSKSQMKKLGLKSSPSLTTKTSSSPLPSDSKLGASELEDDDDLPLIGLSLSRAQKKQLKAEKKAQRRAAKQVAKGRSLGKKDILDGDRGDDENEDGDFHEEDADVQPEEEEKGKTEEVPRTPFESEEPSGYEEDEETGVESVPYHAST